MVTERALTVDALGGIRVITMVTDQTFCAFQSTIGHATEGRCPTAATMVRHITEYAGPIGTLTRTIRCTVAVSEAGDAARPITEGRQTIAAGMVSRVTESTALVYALSIRTITVSFAAHTSLAPIHAHRCIGVAARIILGVTYEAAAIDTLVIIPTVPVGQASNTLSTIGTHRRFASAALIGPCFASLTGILNTDRRIRVVTIRIAHAFHAAVAVQTQGVLSNASAIIHDVTDHTAIIHAFRSIPRTIVIRSAINATIAISTAHTEVAFWTA